ncbi:thioesterase [Rhodovarius crocodyli]|uniref:Thioesterase n=1 Tax=Rhodovarius crocodyli TaxID=1979269 RepID=A0A437MIB1_9PROT|nr:thioesterase family protein [Rhodovarius crocodyli]RVT97397.1 thioesterase [Rhodovarius crocodyli]
MAVLEGLPPPRTVDGWLRWDMTLATVKPEWMDSNKHLNMGYYLVIFDHQTDRLWPFLGLGRALRAQGKTTFAVETWLDYQREMLEGETMGGESRVLDFDEKRLLLEHRMFEEKTGQVTSTNEVLYVCADVAARRVTTWPEEVLAQFRQYSLGLPARRLTLKRRP